MSYEQVKGAFLRYEERRNRLKLLYTEILSDHVIAEELLRDTSQSVSPDPRFSSSPSYIFDTAIMSSILPEIYSIIHTDTDLIESLFRLRIQLNVMNTHLTLGSNRLAFSRPASIANQDSQLLNMTINKQLREYTLPLLKKVINQMESQYGLDSPFMNANFEIFKKEANK